MLKNFMASGILEIMALSVLAFSVGHNPDIRPCYRKYILSAIALTALMIFAEQSASVLAQAGPDRLTVGLHTAANAVGFGLSPFLPLLLVHLFGRGQLRFSFLLWLPACFCLAASCFSAVRPVIFFVGAGNEYRRGPVFGLYVFAFLWGLGVLCLEVFRASRPYPRSVRQFFLLIFLFTGSGMLFQLADPEIHTSWACVCFALILYYSGIGEMNALHDGLTDAFNRTAFQRLLDQPGAMADCRLYLFDVDSFKKINDGLGHAYGDYCLCTVVHELCAAFSNIGCCYRIGGDEFCVLCRSRSSAAEAALARFYSRLLVLRRQDLHLPTVSYGAAVGSGRLGDLFAEADQKLYRCKEEHRSAVQK